VGENVAWSATNGLRADLALHVLRLDMSFHKAYTPGELLERIDGDVEALANFFSRMVLQLLSNALLTGGVVILLFWEHPLLGAVGASYVFLTAVVLRTTNQPAVRAWGESRQAEAELYGFLGERLAGTEDIRANGAEPHVMARLYRIMRTLGQIRRRAWIVRNAAYNAGTAVFLLANVATLAFAAFLFNRGQVTIGTVYLAVSYIGLLQGPMDRIRSEVGDLQRATASIARVRDLFAVRSRLVERARATLPSGPLDVALEGVTFGYSDHNGKEEDEHVLHDVSLRLKAGKALGVLGRTGSGKTTLTRLLFRMVDPTAGTIRLGGAPLADVALRDLHRHIGLVTQEVQLFQASVRDNLTMFAPSIADGRILDALGELGMLSWVQALPAGLDTELQTGGQSLSAGEAQLLAFARVFLKDPGLIILDEASSRLDPATEQMLERAISRLLYNRTAIVVAHRLATVQRADEILILEGGRIAECGERSTLAHDPGSRFYALLQTGMQEALA
jgi:ATP-binding cassette subfamily B protein